MKSKIRRNKTRASIGSSSRTSKSASVEAGTPRNGVIDLDDEQGVTRWCEHFGITRPQLAEAVLAAGAHSDAVREHLLNQGASAGAS